MHDHSYCPEPYQLSDFDFELPEHLIAQVPAAKRTSSRLLVVHGRHDHEDKRFGDIVAAFEAGDILVLNDTRVIPARLMGNKAFGGKLEVLIERVRSEQVALCMIKSNHTPKIGSHITVEGASAHIGDRQGRFFIVELLDSRWSDLLSEKGDIPLPPYIKRVPDDKDRERYQTVYALRSGAVAAPTAGLHFDEGLLHQLRQQGVVILPLTLHVGAGTFQPIQENDLDRHQMHFEYFEIPEKTQQAINTAKQSGRRITAVGTTSLRALEAAAQQGRLIDTCGETNLFIRPGYRFQIVDRLITNFHLPKSSLMLLVSAFAGYETIKSAYRYAIETRYRFFSYGDAMLLKYQR